VIPRPSKLTLYVTATFVMLAVVWFVSERSGLVAGARWVGLAAYLLLCVQWMLGVLLIADGYRGFFRVCFRSPTLRWQGVLISAAICFGLIGLGAFLAASSTGFLMLH